MDQYQAKIEEVEDRISRLYVLREAQMPSSRHRVHFQEQINALTDELLLWQQNAPRLAELDALIKDTTTRIGKARRDAQRLANGWLQAAFWFGIPGLLLTLINLNWTQTVWLLVVGVLLILAAVGALFMRTQARRDGQDAVYRQRGVLDALQLERDSLLPRQ